MKNRTLFHIDVALACAALVGVALILCAGCNIVGPIAFIIEGPPTNPSVAALDANRATVVFIDDRNSRLPKRSLRSTIASTAEQLLLDKGIITKGNMIAASSVMRAASSESGDSPMSIVDLGREVGAEVIIYVDVQVFTLSLDGASKSPAANLDVKIFDTVANTRLWPDADTGYPLVIRVPTSQGQVFGMSLSERSTAERQFAQRIGMRIAQLFYDTPRTTGLGK